MKYLFVFLVVGLMVSCSDSNSDDSNTAKLSNCDEIEGLQFADESIAKIVTGKGGFNWTGVPSDYTGVVKTCSNGKVKKLTHYKDGKQEGVSRSWHSDGQLWYEENFKDGQQDGLSRSYHWDGQLQFEGNYKDGKKDGLYRRWWHNGQLQTESNYKDGKPDGLCREWSHSGQLSSEKYWKDGNPYGLHRWWYENGQLEREVNYSDGVFISEKCWDKDGNEEDCP